MECGAWQEELELMETVLEFCEDKNGVAYAILVNSWGSLRPREPIATRPTYRWIRVWKSFFKYLGQIMKR